MRKKNKLYGRATVVRSNPHRSYAGGERSTGEMRDPGMQPHSYFFRASVDSTWRCASWATHFLTHTNRRACARMSETRVGHGVSCVGGQQQCNMCRCGRAHTSNAARVACATRRACAPLREGNMDPCTHGDTTGITVSSQLQIVGRAFCIGIGTLVPGWFIRFDRW